MSNATVAGLVPGAVGRTAALAALALTTLTGWGAVGAGARAPGGSAAPPFVALEPEIAEVLVARRDLPAGTILWAEEQPWIAKRVPKSAVPPEPLFDAVALAGRRLTRAARAGEAFGPDNLSHSGLPLTPDGYDYFSIPCSRSVSKSVAVGDKVDVLATLPGGTAFTSLRDVPVVAVELYPEWRKEGPKPENLAFVSFALDRKQGLVLALAKSGSCMLKLVPSAPDRAADPNYNIDAVIELLSATEVAPAPRLK